MGSGKARLNASGLTPKQQIFCDEYLKDLNATQAAIRAKYSKKTAHKIATENLHKPVIKAYIAKRMKDREERTEVTIDRVVQELAIIAFQDLGDVAKWDKDGIVLKDSTKLSSRQRKIMESISSTPVGDGKGGSLGTAFKFKTRDKVKALELLGKHTGAFDGKKPDGDDNSDTESRLLGVVEGLVKAGKATGLPSDKEEM